MGSYENEVIPQAKACCENARTLDHFCGNGTLLTKGKRSRCNECGTSVPAEVWRSNDDPPRVYMRKYCPEHGVTSSRISGDARFYFAKAAGSANSCCPEGNCAPSALGENAKTGSQLHTCTLVVEVVRDCNLSCPTCYADSPKRAERPSGDYLSIDDLLAQIRPVIASQGKIDILQLSGGEPTLHPEFFPMLRRLSEEKGISDILLNTNGVKLADPLFMRALADTAPKGRFGVYLQYDGDGADAQKELRGGDFRRMRERVLESCGKHGISVALVMTVTHENKFDCASTLDRALKSEHVRWVVYQPEFLSGRNNKEKMLEHPINVADIIHSVARGGKMDLDSWIPLPCSDPNCGTVGFMVRRGGVWHPASRFVDMRQFTPLIADRMNFDIDDSMSSCGCDDYDLGSYLVRFGIAKEDVKMVFVKPFMDVRSWDDERIASCCTHVLTPEGKVDSFCRHYGLR